MGLFDRTNVRYARAGVRVGAVMTGEMGSGFLRGTFEEDVAFMPVDYILWSGYRSVYGFSVNPVNLKWNFTTPRRTIPDIVAHRFNVSAPMSSMSTAEHFKGELYRGYWMGFNHFLRPGRSLSFEFKANHFSNASLGDHNPGINSSLQISPWDTTGGSTSRERRPCQS